MSSAVSAPSKAPSPKPILSPMRLLEMNLGFLGLQFSFGMQQGNMSPIYSYLGAKEAELPILLLAGPMTGLLVQPVIGALSDRTAGRFGRRAPYFIIGAVLCTLGLFLMPYSSSLLMAASLLWVLDAGNNTTMEPYRAYVSDRLAPEQQNAGFLIQAAFTGLAQMLAFLTPSFLTHVAGINIDKVDAHGIPETAHIAFTVGAFLSMGTILWSILRVPELPLTEAETARIKATPVTVASTFTDIFEAIRDMPQAMRKLAVMSLFQWYGMAAYWGYVIYSIGRSVYGTSDPHSHGFHEAVQTNGEMAAFYNAVSFVSAFAMIPVSKRFGPGRVHAVCLALAGIGMVIIPGVTHKEMLFLPAIGIGLGWGSIMGNPYAILSSSIPPERTGVYMGIFNMMIVIPMLLIAVTLPFFYGPLLGSDPRNVLRVCGVLLGFAAVAAVWAAGKPEPDLVKVSTDA
jgi:maltose/moltooligosaccharide transporter